MVPLHLAIGLVEGIATAAVLSVLFRARPDLACARASARTLRPVVVGLGVAALLTAGAFSSLASTAPDGLEWSVTRTAGAILRGPADGIRGLLARAQAALAPFPDYRLPGQTGSASPPSSPGTSLAGVAGAGLTLAVVFGAFASLRWARRRKGNRP